MLESCNTKVALQAMPSSHYCVFGRRGNMQTYRFRCALLLSRGHPSSVKKPQPALVINSELLSVCAKGEDPLVCLLEMLALTMLMLYQFMEKKHMTCAVLPINFTVFDFS